MTTDESAAPEASPLRKGLPPAGLFLLLVAVYQINGPFLRVGDAQPNLYLPVQILTRGTLTFSPDETPFMFLWSLRGDPPGRTISVNSWDDVLRDRPAAELRASGDLVAAGPRYYLVETTRPGRYAGIYGPGAGLSAVPYFALLSLVRSGWCESTAVLGAESKLFASACIAGSAVLIYFSFLLFAPVRPSLLFALLYGIGTCVWAEPSQALWQQTPAIFCVALGAYCFLRMPAAGRWGAACGAAWGYAALCRPSLMLLLAVAAVWALATSRKTVIPLLLGAALPLAGLFLYNAGTLGSPFRFGQAIAAERIAAGHPVPGGAWSGNVFAGLAGLFFSPSRGIVIFSPFFLCSLWGAARCWKDPAVRQIRPLAIATAGLSVLAACWFQWWGGWSFGYRLLSDLAPLGMLLLIPVVPRLRAAGPLRSVFGFLAFWSIAVQSLGAFGYDPAGWNNRSAYRLRGTAPGSADEWTDMEEAVRRKDAGSAEILGTVEMDVSLPEFRHRLWSVRDSQLGGLLRPHAVHEGYLRRRHAADGAARERAAPR